VRRRSRVEVFEEIRRDARLDPSLSVRQLAKRHGVHRRAVRQALVSAVPLPRKVYANRPRPAIDPWVEVIDSWLIADQSVAKKQRHTARRVWQRLIAEHGASLAEVTVSRYVGRRRVELGLVNKDVFVPQTHPRGAEAEVDFGEFDTTIAGSTVRLWMFVMRLSHSGRAFHVAYGTQAQEAFLQGHVEAFAHFGGVPGRVRYDNLKPAVTRVLRGRNRDESDRFTALRSHYGFDAFFCIPGKEGAHEKGGVEGEIGPFRRRHLVPVPTVTTMAGLNDLIRAGRLPTLSRRAMGVCRCDVTTAHSTSDNICPEGQRNPRRDGAGVKAARHGVTRARHRRNCRIGSRGRVQAPRTCQSSLTIRPRHPTSLGTRSSSRSSETSLTPTSQAKKPTASRSSHIDRVPVGERAELGRLLPRRLARCAEEAPDGQRMDHRIMYIDKGSLQLTFTTMSLRSPRTGRPHMTLRNTLGSPRPSGPTLTSSTLSSPPFSGWGGVFGDQAVAAATIDRIVHHADVLTLKGASYRLRNRGIDTLPSIKTQDTAHEATRTGGLVFERRIGLTLERCRQPPLMAAT
jgi:transposase/lambda repressor-like predicted transcriptional regulator